MEVSFSGKEILKRRVILELKIVDFVFIFIYFSILNLELEYNMTSHCVTHVTATVTQSYIISKDIKDS